MKRTLTNEAPSDNEGGFSLDELESQIDKMYLDLMRNGWKLNEIDMMDIHYYFKLVGVAEHKNKVYIDEIF